ncbi:hypothetical protein MRX96_053483 [Rhipicephalus microplus]
MELHTTSNVALCWWTSASFVFGIKLLELGCQMSAHGPAVASRSSIVRGLSSQHTMCHFGRRSPGEHPRGNSSMRLLGGQDNRPDTPFLWPWHSLAHKNACSGSCLVLLFWGMHPAR